MPHSFHPPPLRVKWENNLNLRRLCNLNLCQLYVPVTVRHKSLDFRTFSTHSLPDPANLFLGSGIPGYGPVLFSLISQISALPPARKLSPYLRRNLFLRRDRNKRQVLETRVVYGRSIKKRQESRRASDRRRYTRGPKSRTRVYGISLDKC